MGLVGDAVTRLRPMTETEFAAFRETFVAEWAEDLRRIEGRPAHLARVEARTGLDELLPDGLATQAAWLFTVLDGETPVGTLWLAMREEGHAHVSDVLIAEAHRGRGHGRRALELAEAEALRRGARSIGLRVYADNERARRLYERLGYAPTTVELRKPLLPAAEPE